MNEAITPELMAVQLEFQFQEEIYFNDPVFDPRQCAICRHGYLDIGIDSKKRDFKCHINPQICKTRTEFFKPAHCKYWERNL